MLPLLIFLKFPETARKYLMKKTFTNVLQPSTPDLVNLHVAVEQRFLQLTQEFESKKGERLIPPPSLNSAMIRWRQLAVRFKKGDFRNTESEELSLKEIAQWTVDENCLLRGQPKKKVVWR